MENLSGTNLKGYRLEERIGSGGFGAVYRARQITVGREVAIKIILPGLANQPDFVRRFEGEAHTIARLEHPHITPLHDYWRDPQGAYLVMRYLRGQSLREALDKGTFELPTITKILGQLAAALDFAHRYNVIHRDIKPGNILLDEDGNAYLADFGIAKDLSLKDDVTGADMIVGSLDYISPEQARSEPVTPRTDIYSLGVTIFEMITGDHPFKDVSSMERLYKHINDPLPLITNLDDDVIDEVNEVIQIATAKDPSKRYADVLEFSEAFRKAAGEGFTKELSLVEQLTLREQEVLNMIIQGKTNRQIADELFVTVSTVKWHIAQAYKKLGVRSRVQAIVRARELNLIVADDSDSSGNQMSQDSISVTLPEPNNPYKGLRAFYQHDAPDFFGRESLIEKLIERMQSTNRYSRFLAIIGPSGSGKSSLVKAGLIPAIWKGKIPESEKWFIADMLPGTHPMDKLETALIRVAGNQTINLHDQLNRDDRGLLRIADIILPDDGSDLVIVVDQFEEVFTLTDNEAMRQHFLNLLLTAVSDVRSRVRIVVTLRADYYDRPLMYPEFGELLRNRMETVLPLSAQGLERAIRGPAERVGVTFEQGLVEQIVSQMNYQAGALPLLQYALTELFDRRRGRVLTNEAYQAIGGAVGALANRTDEIYQSMTPEAQELTHQMFMRLVTLGEGAEDTRRRATQEELLSLTDNTDLMEEIIDQFALYRLLSLDHDTQTRQPIVEVAHEAILREWDQVRAWINDSRAELRLHRQLRRMVSDWNKANHDKSYLLHGGRLDQFEGWQKSTSIVLTPEEKQFMQASIELRIEQEKQEQSRQQREQNLEKRAQRFFQILAVVMFIAAIGGVGLSLFAFDRESQARVERDNAREFALVNGARAALATGDQDTAVALAINANQRPNPSSASTTILSQTAYELGAMRVLDRGAFYLHVDVNNDGTLAITGDPIGGVKVFDVVSGDVLYELEGHSASISDVGFSDDGTMAYTAGDDLSIILWDVATGEIIQRLEGDMFLSPTSITADFSPNGEYLISTNGARSWMSEEPLLLLWDIETGTVIREFRGHTQWIGDVVITNDGERVLSGADYEEIILWDLETGEEIRRRETLSELEWRVPSDILLHPDNQSAILVYADTSAERIEFETLLTLMGYGEHISDSNWWWTEGALTPDGKYLYTYQKNTIWNVTTGDAEDQLAELSPTFGADIMPDGQSILLGRNSDLRQYAIFSGAKIHQYGYPDNFFTWDYDVSANGQILLIAKYKGFGDTLQCAMSAYDTNTGKLLVQNTDPELIDAIGCMEGLMRVAISPDGQYAVSGTINGLIYWNVATGEIVQTMTGHTSRINAVDIDLKGERALSTSCAIPDIESCSEAEIIVWDLPTGEEIQRLIAPEQSGGIGTFNNAVFSPDGQNIMSAHSSNVALYWDVESGELLYQLEPLSQSVRTVAISPDGTQAITTGANSGDFTVWDLQTGEIIITISGAGRVTGADFTLDGKQAVTTGERVSLWNLETGEEVRRYTNETGLRLYPRMGPDGNSFYFFAGVINRYRIDDNEELMQWTLENRYIRDLSCSERTLYGIEPACD